MQDAVFQSLMHLQKGRDSAVAEARNARQEVQEVTERYRAELERNAEAIARLQAGMPSTTKTEGKSAGHLWWSSSTGPTASTTAAANSASTSPAPDTSSGARLPEVKEEDTSQPQTPQMKPSSSMSSFRRTGTSWWSGSSLKPAASAVPSLPPPAAAVAPAPITTTTTAISNDPEASAPKNATVTDSEGALPANAPPSTTGKPSAELTRNPGSTASWWTVKSTTTTTTTHTDAAASVNATHKLDVGSSGTLPVTITTPTPAPTVAASSSTSLAPATSRTAGYFWGLQAGFKSTMGGGSGTNSNLSPTSLKFDQVKFAEMKQERLVLEGMIAELRKEVATHALKERTFQDACAKDAYELVEQIFVLHAQLQEGQERAGTLEGTLTEREGELRRLRERVSALETPDQTHQEPMAKHEELGMALGQLQVVQPAHLEVPGSANVDAVSPPPPPPTTTPNPAPAHATPPPPPGEIEAARRRILGLEASIKELQTKLQQATLDRVEGERKLRAELEERAKLERSKTQTEADCQRREGIAAAEKAGAEQRRKLETELKARSDECTKLGVRARTLEQESASTRAAHFKAQEEWQAKLSAVEKLLAAQKAVATETVAKEAASLAETASQRDALQSQCQLLVAELEAARTSQELMSRLHAEKEEQLKRTRQRIDELVVSEAAAKKQAVRADRERAEQGTHLEFIRNQLVAVERALQQQQQELQALRDTTTPRIAELEGERTRAGEALQASLAQLEEQERSFKLQDRKSAQIIRDLQKQLAKERKRDDASGSAERLNAPEQLSKVTGDVVSPWLGPAVPTPVLPFPRPAAAAHAMGLGGHDVPGQSKQEKLLTEDFLRLSKENEALNRRACAAEDQLKRVSEQTGKLMEDLDVKGRVIQQMVLRENLSKIQPDERPRIGLQFFSSSATLQKLDPALLASVNTKLQKLLEEMTTKTILMEEELKRIHAGAA